MIASIDGLIAKFEKLSTVDSQFLHHRRFLINQRSEQTEFRAGLVERSAPTKPPDITQDRDALLKPQLSAVNHLDDKSGLKGKTVDIVAPMSIASGPLQQPVALCDVFDGKYQIATGITGLSTLRRLPIALRTRLGPAESSSTIRCWS